MFNKRIRENPLTQGIANDFFKIQGDAFNDDRSFLATLRGLLYRRSRDAAVSLSLRSADVRGFKGYTDAADIFRRITPTPLGANNLVIRYLVGTADDYAHVFRMYDSGFCAANPGFHEAQDLRLFVLKRGKLEARFYINEGAQETLVLCSGLTLANFHLLQSITPRLLPWFFTQIPLDETEIALLDSLTFRTATEYEGLIASLAQKFDFRDYAIKKIVGDFDQIGRREEIQETNNEIDNCRRDMDSIQQRYLQHLQRLDELNVRLAGQEMALASASESSELVDYFSCNRNLMPTRTRNRRLEFTVKTFLENFDPEQYSAYVRRESSCLFTGYEYLPEFSDPAVRRKMLGAIFSDEPILKIKVCSNYIIDLRGSSSASQYYNYSEDFIDYIPNPHIQRYACLGNYKPYIDRAIQNGNLIGAIGQCVASAGSLNLAESSTTRFFLNDVFTSRHKIIRLPDGRDATPLEALNYLNGLDAAKEESNG